ncbi:MAG: penicillin-binding transpeptidase domain-containing protein, partial [Bacteroidota bacterium]
TSIEPGSTFKIASATALLDDDLVQMCDTFDTGNGTLTFDDKEITDNGHAFGLIDFESIIAYSSNVGMALAVNQHYGENPDRYIWHLHRFGFGDIVNTQLKGEPVPHIIKPEDDEWSIAALPSLSYGYSLEVTPLQMATFYNGLANQGKQMRPWLITEIRNNSQVIDQFGPEVLNEKMCLPSTAVKLREMMKGVTKYGTASKAFRKMPFEIAGKTGTVRKIENGKYVKKYRASFGGYFPADQPRYTLYVMVDDPNGGAASGGKVAAPIFREIAQQIYKMDQELSQPPAKRSDKPTKKPAAGVMYAQSAEMIYKTLNIETSGMPDTEWFKAESNGHQINLGKQELSDRIPDMKGMSGRDAIHLMEQMGVKVRLQGIGRVRRQSLLPGYRIGEETSIILFLG